MNPDYFAPEIVRGLATPIVVVFVFAFGMLGWTIALQLSKEVTTLRIKLGKEDPERKIQWSKKLVSVVRNLSFSKTFRLGRQFLSTLKQSLKKKRKDLKLVFRWVSMGSITSIILQIVRTGTSSERGE